MAKKRKPPSVDYDDVLSIVVSILEERGIYMEDEAPKPKRRPKRQKESK